MNTPIYDFIKAYAEKNGVRFHMPGHKGRGPLGIEALDITEIEGADVLGAASGIIAQSEANATALFRTGRTLYTTEGSTAAIKAMLTLATRTYRTKERPVLLAARNAHRAFLHGAALLDLSVSWLSPKDAKAVYSGIPTPGEVEDAILKAEQAPFALYITSPSYLGELADIAGISAVCRRYGIPLLVDNAHGAYLAYLSPSLHPIHLGAAMCADSAHKTLPALTGCAYLHIAKAYSDVFTDAKDALALFSSTSPSYLQLASLDLCNQALSERFPDELSQAVALCEKAKGTLSACGFTVLPCEPLKLVLADANTEKLCKALRDGGIEPEFADGMHLVLMASAANKPSDFDALVATLAPLGADAAAPLQRLPRLEGGDAVLSIRKALFAQSERIAVPEAYGRICADTALFCPPAVPIAICGERITKKTVDALLYYGIDRIKVVK